MALTITKFEATPTTLMVFYSGPVDGGNTNGGAANPANYTLTAPKSGIHNGKLLSDPESPFIVAYDKFFSVAIVSFKPTATLKLQFGDTLTLDVKGITVDGSTTLPNQQLTAQVNGINAQVEAVEDAVAYPLLTEQVSFPGSGGGGTTFGSAATSASLSQTAVTALSDVLGWKVNPTDAKGFVGALTQSFTLTDFEGHTEATWKPRTYAVQTDLSGGITGAQASLYSMAKTALDQSLPLLNGLYPLDPEAEMEDVAALKELARSQMTEIVKELGKVGGPSTFRVDQYFKLLIGTHPPTDADGLTQSTLQEIRDTYGIKFVDAQTGKPNPFSNTIEDETNVTNFRIIVDYMLSLLQTWNNNRSFFALGTNAPKQAFLGTQLVLISRQFSVIVETVNEVRFTLNSVFIGPSERQTLLLEFSSASGFTPMFLEDILMQIEAFASDEGPRLIQNGGRHSVTNNVSPVVKSLKELSSEMRKPLNRNKLPDGFRTVRVKHSLDDLHDQLRVLEGLASGIGRRLPAPEGDFGLLVFPQPLILTAKTDEREATSEGTGTLKLANRGIVTIANISIVVPSGFTAHRDTGTATGFSVDPMETVNITVEGTPKTGGTLTITGDGIESIAVQII